MHKIALCIVYSFVQTYYYTKSLLIKRLLRYTIIINEKISTKYGPGCCSILAHFGDAITKWVIFQVFNPLITFEPVNKFKQN